MQAIETILTSGINKTNASQLKSLVREQYNALNASEFKTFAQSHKLPTMGTKSATLKAINNLIDNQSVLSVQTAR